MFIRGDFHMHTAFCDGEATPKEMVEAALAQGLTAMGFSGHSYVTFDGFGMDAKTEAAYKEEIRALKAAYAGRISIFCGLEKEVYSPLDTAAYDYVIASGHYAPLPDGGFTPVDYTPKVTAAAIAEHFGGDGQAYAAAYYEGLTQRLLQEPRVDIVGHFDLVTKFNQGNRYFDEDAPAYKTAALAALEAVAAKHPLFEINTGAMSRGWRNSPYPALFLLRRLKELNGRIILSSDSHSTKTLLHGFADAAAIAKAAGFTEADVLTADGLRGVKL